MSLHAHITEEAERQMRRQVRRSQILSVVIACLSIVLIGGVLALFALPMMVQETPTIITYRAELDDQQNPEEKKVVRQTQRKPAAPAQNMAQVIAANTASPTAIPVPEMEISEPSLHFGDDIDFGQGWADDNVFFDSGGGFGSTNPASGGLEGFLYDLKQDSERKPLPYNASTHFGERLLGLQRSGYSKSELSKYFRSPVPLYMTRLAIPITNAVEGPKLFGAEEFVDPKGWIAHYRGKVVAPKTGTFRFSGLADDYLMVALDGNIRLHASYPGTQGAVIDGWRRTSPTDHPAPFDKQLIYGDWVNLQAGQEVLLEIAIGERPGGRVWFYLQIEEKDVNYRKTSGGRPILPLFTTAPIMPHEVEQLTKDFDDYEIEFDPAKALIFIVKR